MLLLMMLLLMGDGSGGEDPIGPEPDTGGTFGRRRVATYVKRGGVGSLRGRLT